MGPAGAVMGQTRFSAGTRGGGREVNGVFRGATLRVNLVKLLRGQFNE